MSEENGINGDAKTIYGQYDISFLFPIQITSQLPLFFVSSPCVSIGQVAQWAADWLDMPLYVRLREE
jgi:hypothetical protein